VRVASAGLALLAAAAACGGEAAAPEEPRLADVARIECSESGVSVTPRVRARPDGVHVLVVTRSERMHVTLMGPDGGLGGADGAVVHPFPPGRVEARCYDTELDRTRVAPFEVVDEEGVWISTNLSCRSILRTIPEYAGEPGKGPDPVEAARENFADRLRPGDRVEAAGYPRARNRQVRIVRDDEVLAVQTFRPSGLVEETARCERFAPQP
jgi:hypothetical protein